MAAGSWIFYVLAVFILATALLSVTTTKIFRAAIWLLFSLIGVAAFYFWMELEFIAAVQIIVYVGGIVVLIIFSIFLTQQSGQSMQRPSVTRLIAATIASLSGIALSILCIAHHTFSQATSALDSSVATIGSQLLDSKSGGFALPFEAVSMLLLSAMVGCIVIAMKSRDTGNKIDSQQIAIKQENKI